MTTNEPLLLLHGIGMSSRAWDDVIPLLSPHYEVIAPTAAGHRGGPPLAGETSIGTLADETERLLDCRGLARVHVAGNSLGGWMAIELARRGRAISVCALSPAGFWTPGATDQLGALTKIRRTRRLARIAGPIAPALLRVPALRRHAMRDIAEHGERLTANQTLNAMADLLGCSRLDDLLATPESTAALNPLPCPITLAWSAKDKIFPPEINGLIARQRLPHAAYVLLPDLGHVPMIDNPRLVADTILRSTQSYCEDNS
ncbi:alpha/beta fold hydrolase [Mycobacterium sp. 1245852.3]|uniref:alpha/beta fold hydrolase n=1 Tax=Mycobacterium sp. 1245852.3 TaxID=1856860 RepID=UPI0008021E19|nr:alpha/beta hydrolase [Mycobacterium sp. 1245852.3]OBJ83275.1 hydrolase [Mycobacterium sp. 1245852.3]